MERVVITMHTEVPATICLPIESAQAALETVGGKGASLAKLANAGLPVPDGFHVTTEAYRRFVADNSIQAAILAAVSGANPLEPSTLEVASSTISGLFAGARVPEEIAAAIKEAYAALPGNDPAVAVRSSATAEDLPDLSFAGQQETFLNIHGTAAVQEAVKRCWASLWTARAIGYRAQHGIDHGSVSIAVVVQLLVPAEAAGVLFTANPVSGRRDQAMISAAWGLGETIVGGTVTPDTLTVEKGSGRVVTRVIADKRVMTVRTEDGTGEQPTPESLRNAPVLTDEQAAELARLGVRIEGLYGMPMDIEWAWTSPPSPLLAGEAGFAILQARPITALPEVSGPRPLPPSEWKLPNPKGPYMRSSVFELLPDPLSPLFATLGLPAWSSAMAEFLREMRASDLVPGEMMVTINGYGYYDINLTARQKVMWVVVLPGLFAAFPRLLGSAEQRWWAARSRYAAVVDRWQGTDLATTPAGHLLDGAREISGEAAGYYLTMQSGILPGAYISELFFTLAYDKLLKRRGDPSALTFVLGFDSAPMRAEKSLYDLAQWLREQPELGAAVASMSGEQFSAAYWEHVEGAEAPDATRVEFWRRLSIHLAEYGHNIYDLDFAKPLLADDPAPALETLKFFMSGKAPNPHERQRAAEVAREEATGRMLTRLRGVRLSLFRRLVRSAQDLAPLREDALADVGLGWPVLRRMLRQVGQRLVAAGAAGTADDVFWLELGELRQAATVLDEGRQPEDYRAVIGERRALWKSQRATTPPVALPLKGGTRFFGIDFKSVMPARSDQPEGGVLKGVAASPGRVTAAARVIHGPEEFEQMRQGDILVARITTPAWTPLFALAAGIVTDVGGPLSHGSIVAREYRIPAVLGTGVATERLRSGQGITVDGDAGTVTLEGGGAMDVGIAVAPRPEGSRKVGSGLALAITALAAFALWRMWEGYRRRRAGGRQPRRMNCP